MKRLPAEYIDFLKLLQSNGYSEAIIAGGAVRDVYCGNAVKDVDIFVQSKKLKFDNKPLTTNSLLTNNSLPELDFSNKLSLNIQKAYVVLGLDKSKGDSISYAKGTKGSQRRMKAKLKTKSAEGRNHVSAVWDIKKSGIDFQIIAVEMEPVKYITEFIDFGICMCYHDGKNATYTPAFFRDYQNKTLTLCGKMDGEEIARSLAYHLPRLQKKFPGFAIAIDPKPIVEYYLSK